MFSIPFGQGQHGNALGGKGDYAILPVAIYTNYTGSQAAAVRPAHFCLHFAQAIYCGLSPVPRMHGWRKKSFLFQLLGTGCPMFDHLTTEARNPASEDLDGLSALELVRLINTEDAKVTAAVAEQAEAIAHAIDVVAERLSVGGRLIYIGAGTSGRLGVLDAVECPPTFNTRPSQVVGVIAGGYAALTSAVEGAEDQAELAIGDLKNIQLAEGDVLVGIATSGRTPYVVGSLEYAKQVGAFTIGISCNRDPQLATCCDISITPVVGPEVVSGSTRMKAGTATKMVLNMLSTGAMIRLGKTFGNLMVDLRASNTKLADRARRIVQSITQLSPPDAERLLQECNGEVKTAILRHDCGISATEARELLSVSHGHLRRALQNHFAKKNGDG